MMYTLIVAHDEELGIGLNNKLPWHSPIDLDRFKKITSNGHCIMGRNTYESILQYKQKLKLKNHDELLVNRESYIVSNTIKTVPVGCKKVFRNIEEINTFFENHQKPNIFIIGGSALYKTFLPYISSMYTTTIKGKYNCDTFFTYPDMSKFKTVSRIIIFDKKLQSDVTFYHYQLKD